MADYIVNSPAEQAVMLARVGAENVADFFEVLPREVKISGELNLAEGLSEIEVLAEMQTLADANTVFKTIFRGAGAYKHAIPAAVNHLASRSEFVTAYTPYQPEISQGILQSIFEFQTNICELTGLDLANASVYDGATAAGEAILMCAERKRKQFLIAGSMNPGVQDVAKTYCAAANYACETIAVRDGRLDLADLSAKLNRETAAVLLDQVNYFGLLEDVDRVAAQVHAAGAKLVLSINPIAAAILPSAAECGADVAIGEAQPLGTPLSFGGPYIGFMACTKAEMRKMPGRIVGETKDLDGKKAYVLTLQAREQHIRREKAISSICSNQALMAVRATIYLAMLGAEGLAEVAQSCVNNAHYLADALSASGGFELAFEGEFFHEFVVKTKADAFAIEKVLIDHGILPGLVLDKEHMLWCATECNTRAEMDRVVTLIKEAGLC